MHCGPERPCPSREPNRDWPERVRPYLPDRHVQGSIAAIEAEIAREQLCSSPDNAANVIVLDDVTPRYAKASAVLDVCRANLSTALHVLTDTKGSARCNASRT